MPVGNLRGWKQVYHADFSRSFTRGAFPGAYSSKLAAYDGFLDTFSDGMYNRNIISAHGGALDVYLHTTNGRPQVAALVPLINGQWGGQTYGRFSVRMKADSLDGYGPSFLLWSDRNRWSDGEVDFPESALSHTIMGYNHCLGRLIAQNCMIATTHSNYAQWHTYTIDWTPRKLSLVLDGNVIGSSTHVIPTHSMHWVLQFEAFKRNSTGESGHALIDWMTFYSYSP